VMRFHGEDSDINIKTRHPEFSSWRWVDMNDLQEIIVPFKRDIYKALSEKFYYLTE